MDELADGTLLANPELSAAQRSEYTHALQLLRGREYQRALSILNAYKDYNTALTLTCLGYDVQAYSLLSQLKKNANTHYLGAILCARLQKAPAAVDHLVEAIRLNPDKLYRADRDPEISKLIRDYRLSF